MDVYYFLESLPRSIKEHIIDLDDVHVLIKDKRKRALRVLLDKVLTSDEKDSVRKNKRILNIDGIAQYRRAPEIKHSYFYVLY